MATPTTGAVNTSPPQQQLQSTITPQQSQPLNLEDYQLFPLVLDIISRIKDDEIDLIRAVNLTNEKKQKSLSNFSKLSGINRSLEDQEQLLKQHKQTLKKKVELLEKLKKLELFQKYKIIQNDDSNQGDTEMNDTDNNNNKETKQQQEQNQEQSEKEEISQKENKDDEKINEEEEDIMKE